MFRTLITIFLAATLFAAFLLLGSWQIQRLQWKRALIAQVEQQLASPPINAPGRLQWSELGPPSAYQPVTVTGEFNHQQETLVQAMTRYGSGYWVLTPLKTDRGFTVLINRGFVPPEKRRVSDRADALPAGPVRVRGLLRLTEPEGRVLRANDPEAGRWYSRDVAAIGASLGLRADQLAPYFIDAGEAPNPGGWPVGGLTVVQFRNTHLAYAITWYALAVMTLVGLGIVLRYQSRKMP